jgi:hypothetical protein
VSAPEPVKAGQCRVNGNGDRVVIDSVTEEVVWYRTLHADSDGEVSAHAPECELLSVVERWRRAVAP